jgi:hypothetical protein
MKTPVIPLLLALRTVHGNRSRFLPRAPHQLFHPGPSPRQENRENGYKKNKEMGFLALLELLFGRAWLIRYRGMRGDKLLEIFSFYCKRFFGKKEN